MSQNRAAKKDSLRSLNDYKTDLKSELILEVLHEQIKDIQISQKKILKLLFISLFFDTSDQEVSYIFRLEVSAAPVLCRACLIGISHFLIGILTP